MVGQSLAIIIVILVMSFMFLRAGRPSGALLALPLVSVPLFHLLAFGAYRIFSAGAAGQTLHIAADATGFAAGLLCCWLLSRAIGAKKLRFTYFIGCALFLAALLAAYVRHHF